MLMGKNKKCYGPDIDLVCDACKWLVGGLCSRAASGGCWKGCTFLCTRIPHPIGAVTCLGICLTACGFLLAYETSTWLLKKFAGGPIYVENIVFCWNFLIILSILLVFILGVLLGEFYKITLVSVIFSLGLSLAVSSSKITANLEGAQKLYSDS